MAAIAAVRLAIIFVLLLCIVLPAASADDQYSGITTNVLHAYWEEPGFFNESFLNLSALETAWVDDAPKEKSTEATPSISEVAITSGTKMATTDHVRATVTLANLEIPDETFHYEITYTIELYESAWPFPILRFTKPYKRSLSGGFPTYTYCVEYSEDGIGRCSLSYSRAAEYMTHLKDSNDENIKLLDFIEADSGKQYYLVATVTGVFGSLQKQTPPATITVVNPPTPYVTASLNKIKMGGSASIPVTTRNTGGDPKYCYFSPSFSSGLTNDSSGTSIINPGGSSFTFSDYPPESIIKNKQGVEIRSTNELLDTRIIPAAGGNEQQFNIGVKTTASATVGSSQWIYYRYTCTTPTMDPTDLLINKKNYPTSSSDIDQQDWDVRKLSVSVYACDTASDCGTSSWTGSNFCSSDDVYRTWNDYQCLNGGGTSSSCQQIPQQKLVQDCGDDSCGDWGARYCSGDALYHSRTCHDRGCSSGSCSDVTYSQEELAEICMKDIRTYTGEKRWTTVGCKEVEQERIIHRQYVTCSGSECVYTSSDIWENTGNYRNAADGIVCDDGYYCTVSDFCTSGVCGGTDRNCDDGIYCTTDVCEEYGHICTHSPSDAFCSDGAWCNGAETCNVVNGCQPGTTVDCSGNNLPSIQTCGNSPDSNPFTWDFFAGFTSSCNEATDSCTTGTTTVTSTCSVNSCGAECDSTHPCLYARCLSDCRCTLSGDVDGDWKVDIKDLSAVGRAYGSVPGGGIWNPNADFNGDGRVSIVDLAIVGKNFGKSK